MNKEEVEKFYDEFVDYQSENGVNERIYVLFKKMISLGLNNNSNVLELGSGIGALTYLLTKKIKSGKIEAVDISPKSIAFAKQKIKNNNVCFSSADIVTYEAMSTNFNFITLFDVLEHIPIEQHSTLFKNIVRTCDDKTKVLINIPNPEYVQYDINNQPESLQIIDQPIPLVEIAKNLEKSGLELIYFKTYSIWIIDDYQFFILRKKKEFKEQIIDKERNIPQKVVHRVKHWLMKTKYPY